MPKKRRGTVMRLKVKEIAEKKGVNMSQLARHADIDIRTLRRIYHNPTSEVSTATLSKIATALSCSVRDLIED